MTAPAILEIQVAAKRSFAIMTTGASVISGREMFQSPGRAHLSFLRQSRGVLMTVRTPESLARAVLRMTESEAESV